MWISNFVKLTSSLREPLVVLSSGAASPAALRTPADCVAVLRTFGCDEHKTQMMMVDAPTAVLSRAGMLTASLTSPLHASTRPCSGSQAPWGYRGAACEVRGAGTGGTHMGHLRRL